MVPTPPIFLSKERPDGNFSIVTNIQWMSEKEGKEIFRSIDRHNSGYKCRVESCRCQTMDSLRKV